MFGAALVCIVGLTPISGREFLFDLILKLNDKFNDLLADFFRCRNLVGLNYFLKLFAHFKYLWCMHIGDSTFEAMCRAEQILLIRVSEPSRQKFQRFLAGRVEQFSQFAERSRIVVEEISYRWVVEFHRLPVVICNRRLRFLVLIRGGCFHAICG